jgi:hypothetical protein
MIEGTRRVLRRSAKWLAVSVAAAALSAAMATAAHAEAALVSAGVSTASIHDSPIDLTGIGGSGKLSVQVRDLGMPGTIAPPLEGLSFSVYNSTSLFSHAGGGELDLDVSGPGMFFLNIDAIPSLQSRFGLGLVSWYATFEADVSAVPLPASVWLLIAGLAWATGMQRKRAKLAFAH